MEKEMKDKESALPAGASETEERAQKTIKDGIINGFGIIEQVEAGLVELARATVSDAIRATGTVANEGVSVAGDIVKGVVAAAREAGSGLLDGTKSIAKGIIIGVSEVGGDVVSAAGRTAKEAVKGASDVGADVALVARKAVDGIVEAAGEIGGNVNEVAKAAVGGAIEAAGSIGENAVSAVRGILMGVVNGVKDVAGAALPRRDEPKDQ
jgi:hypothetical protein